MFNALKNKIKNQKANLGVIGLGYVGLPLAVNFARVGFKVIGFDTDYDRVANLKKGKSYILDVTTKELREVLKEKRLWATNDFRLLKDCDVILICVPTPLKRKYTPNIAYILQAVKSIKQYHNPGALIVLESTTYPGTTDEVIKPLLEAGGKKCGRDFFLGFSPERIDPGNKKYGLCETPKVVSGVTPQCRQLIDLLYRHIICKVVVVSATRVAETVKLLENTFRIVNIGMMNELAMMCQKLKVNIWEVVDAAKTKPFGFMPFYPGPGVGGHCIPKDPLYLYWKARKLGYPLKFVKLASDINNHMPVYVIERVAGILQRQKKSLRNAKILVLGSTYKNDVKDLRKSPALDIIELFLKAKSKVAYHDPYIPYLKFPHINLKSVALTKLALAQSDCVVVATAHRVVDYDFVLKNAQAIFDCRNVYKASNRKVERL
ncbi:MAG: nucleotide sugar dehydrogenase [Candidatus Omnitrophota bacterium]